MSTRLRIAAVASHPVQYQAPWFRALARIADLQVFFAHRLKPEDQARNGFAIGFDWDIPLRDGYASTFLENVAPRPGPHSFFGCNTPGIRTALADGRFDAVIVNGWQLLTYWQAARAARALGMPVLVRGDSQRQAASLLRRLAKRTAYPTMLRSFDGFLTVGTRNAEYYRTYGVPETRLFASPHCVDNAFFAARSAGFATHAVEMRRQHGISNEAVVFGFVGRLVETKRPADVVAALARAARSGANVHGLIVGDGPLRADLDAAVRQAGVRCTFAGFLNQSSIGRAYAAMNVLVLPSSSAETWGLVVNEAFACGVPAIVSDAAGCAPDLIVEDETGFTYPVGDVAALATRIGALARDHDRRSLMAAQARRHVQRFSPEAAADGTLMAIETLRARRLAGDSVASRNHVVHLAS